MIVIFKLQRERVHATHGMHRAAASDGLVAAKCERAVNDVAADHGCLPLSWRAGQLLVQRQTRRAEDGVDGVVERHELVEPLPHVGGVVERRECIQERRPVDAIAKRHERVTGGQLPALILHWAVRCGRHLSLGKGWSRLRACSRQLQPGLAGKETQAVGKRCGPGLQVRLKKMRDLHT